MAEDITWHETPQIPENITWHTDDHGLARRQALSLAEKAVSPITEYPRHYEEMRKEAESQVGRGFSQIGAGFGEGLQAEPGSLAGLGTFGRGVANVGLGALGFVGSPIGAAYRSVIGQPIEDITGVPREIPEFVAQLATPGLGFTKFPRAPGVAEPGPLIRPPAEVQPPEVALAAERLQKAGLADIPRAITGSRAEQELGQRISNVPIAGAPIAQAVQTTLPAQLEKARDIIAAEHGAGTGANVAHRAGAVLEDAATAETQAREAEAARAHTQALTDWQRAQQQHEAAIAAPEQQAVQSAQQAVGPDLHPQNMGEVVINRVRNEHDAAEARKNALYERAGNLDARISDNAIAPLHRDLAMGLEREGIDTASDATPASRRMMDRIETFSEGPGQRANLAPIGQSTAEIEQLRKNLNFLARGASNDADRYAARQIIQRFDEWYGRAAENHLMPGSDPNALPAMREARAANTDWRTRFGYNQRDDVDRLINKIVRGEEDQHTGPVGVSNALTAGGDKSGPLFNRVMEATNGHPDVAQAIASGTWNKLTRDVTGAPLAPETAQKNILTHLYGKGRDVAERVFSQQQRDLMRAHADAVVEAATRRQAAARDFAAAEPVPPKVEPGPIQRLADQMIGKGASKVSDEDLFNTIYGYTQGGGDIQSLARFVSQLPQGMRGDLGAAFIRQLGVNKAGNFTLDQFASHWNKTTPQAKAILLGNAGPHIAALNDIATVANELKNVKGKFGNPSGSGAQNLFSALISSVAAAPSFPKATATAAALAGGSFLTARMLASPAGASSALKYARAVERANREASPANMAAVKLTQRNLQNTLRSLGAASPATQR
jgi:hypothetical protein